MSRVFLLQIYGFNSLVWFWTHSVAGGDVDLRADLHKTTGNKLQTVKRI